MAIHVLRMARQVSRGLPPTILPQSKDTSLPSSRKQAEDFTMELIGGDWGVRVSQCRAEVSVPVSVSGLS